jgi:excisionase family DNA binding protein
MEENTTPARLLKILEVCERTALSRSTIYRAINEGKLRETRFGRSVRISSNELDRFLNSLSVEEDSTQGAVDLKVTS